MTIGVITDKSILFSVTPPPTIVRPLILSTLLSKRVSQKPRDRGLRNYVYFEIKFKKKFNHPSKEI